MRAVRAVEAEWPAPSYSLFSRNCNHFCDALVDHLLPGQRIPSFINRGARFCSWFPLPGLLPWYVRRYVKAGPDISTFLAGTCCLKGKLVAPKLAY